MSRPLTAAEVAARLGVSPAAIRRLAWTHGIGDKVNDRLRLFDEAAVAALAARVGRRGRPGGKSA